MKKKVMVLLVISILFAGVLPTLQDMYNPSRGGGGSGDPAPGEIDNSVSHHSSLDDDPYPAGGGGSGDPAPG